MFGVGYFWLYHHNHKNWVPSILTHNLWLTFMGMKQKNQNQNQNGQLKKTEFFKIANSQYFLWKFPGLVLGLHSGWSAPLSRKYGRLVFCIGDSEIIKFEGKVVRFLRQMLHFLSRPFWILFCFISMKISQRFLDIKNGSNFWWLPWFPAKNHSPQTFQPPVY